MRQERKAKNCRVCSAVFFPYRTTDAFCSFACAKEYNAKRQTQCKPRPKKAINRVSKKHKSRLALYRKQRQEFLSRPENITCFISGCSAKATTIEHAKGREGYADQEAEDNGVWLLNDVRYFRPCCLKHNLELENNAELSAKHQISKLHDGPRGS